MAKKQTFEEPEDDVPGWVMTFSDVITLLMTFFILLLTFATNQPETFDRMQVAVFGGGGASGFASKAEGMEKDALLMRERSRAGRMSQDGSEIPPEHNEQVLASIDKGVAGLEDNELREVFNSHSIKIPWKRLLDAKGNLSSEGQQRMKMFALQLKRLPLEFTVFVDQSEAVRKGLQLVNHLIQKERIVSSTVGIGVSPLFAESLGPTIVIRMREVDNG